MELLNFSHPLSSAQLEQLSALLGTLISIQREVRVHLDNDSDFVPQVISLVDSLAISPEAWQKEPWLICLPSLNYAAGILLAELHGRIGNFPAIVRMRPVAGLLVTEYEIAEIINLDHVRLKARSRR